MRQLAEIVAAYEKLDALLENERSGGDSVTAGRVKSLQILNDQAYFLLCWGQLEVEIVETCRAAIRRRRSSSDWTVRRAWDFYNPDDRRLSGLSFENRAALVLDRSERPFARTMAHYEIRNRVAHGKLAADRLDIASIVQDFYRVQAALHGAA